MNEDITSKRLKMIQYLKEKASEHIYKLWTIDGVILVRLSKNRDTVKSFTNMDHCKNFIDSLK